MSVFAGLEEEARDKLEEMKPVIRNLNALGVSPNGKMGHGDTSQTVVTYPPIGAANRQDAQEIFKLRKLEGPTTLYIHIPFCNSICSYCSYSRSVTGKNAHTVIPQYLKLVAAEVALWRQQLGGQPIPVESIYIGGGTPTVLSPDMLGQLFENIKDNFVLRDKGEFTLEASPGTVTFEKFAVAVSQGVNRASIGVESFNPHILRDMARDTDVEKTFLALDAIRMTGINHIDIDLIRGYPMQTPADLTRDLEGVQRANLPSVTSYQYAVKPHSKDQNRLGDFRFNQDKINQLHLMFIAGAARLGYHHQAPLVDWYVKGPEWVYQQQIQKWMGGSNLLGIGLGAYGNINGVQYFNHESRTDYKNAVGSGDLPAEKALVLSRDEIMRRRVVLGIKGYVDRQKFEGAFGVDVMDTPFGHEVRTLVDAGALEVTQSAIRMTPEGILFAGGVQKRLYSAACRTSSAARDEREAKDAIMAKYLVYSLA